MAKLRMTLPKEFIEFYYTRPYKWAEQDISQCKKFLELCDPNARQRGGYKQTALHLYVPFEIAKWLVDRGADVNAANTYGTPLFTHAGVGDYDICKLLLEHGADVKVENYAGQTALFYAANDGHYDVVQLLLEHGTDPCHHTYSFADRLTPLLSMLRGIDCVPEKKKAITAELLVNAQQEQGGIPDAEWKQAQKIIAGIGHNYSLRRDDLEEEYRRECDCDAAMEQFYTLFDVTPAAPVMKHNGTMPIVADENLPVDKQHHAFWEFLVPASGKCATLQGEVIRITGRVANESKGNAGVNWDAEYRKMLKALLEFFKQGDPLNEKDMEVVQQAVFSINSCKACGCWEETDKLKELAVKWVKQNPTPISLNNVNYRR